VSLAPTTIVHEAYLRIASTDEPRWGDRSHFLALAARCMRQVIVDHQRGKSAAKRGGGWKRVTLSGVAEFRPGQEIDAIALEDALAELERHDPRQARVVELKFFGGLDNAEAAQVLGVATATIEREWRHARAWLAHRLLA
jgi:RNA polymerase sigma factor (TIGR02999 family)